jgi:hypothetical protein
MFDDLNPSQGKEGAPGQAQAPKPVEDIFSAADPIRDDKADKPAFANLPAGRQGLTEGRPEVFQPKQPMHPSAADASGQMKTDHSKRFFFLGFIVLIAVIAVFGGFWAFARFGKPYLAAMQAAKTAQTQENQQAENTALPDEKASPTQDDNATVPTDSKEEPEPAEAPADLSEPAVLDSDQDGLTDGEEKDIYKTDPNSTDTDGDGLFDREEAKVYKTDPLAADTDGDGYSDGAEVKAGYNPSGPGKLYDIN